MQLRAEQAVKESVNMSENLQSKSTIAGNAVARPSATA